MQPLNLPWRSRIPSLCRNLLRLALDDHMAPVRMGISALVVQPPDRLTAPPDETHFALHYPCFGAAPHVADLSIDRGKKSFPALWLVMVCERVH